MIDRSVRPRHSTRALAGAALVLAAFATGAAQAIGSPAQTASPTAVPAAALTVRKVDVARSRATFSVAHVLVSKVVGSIPILSGNVTYAGGGPLPTRVEAVLDPRRVASGDAKRDADLQAPDWFDTARYPTWTFRGDRVEPTHVGFVVHGLLTVHGTPQACDLLVETLPDVRGELHERASAVVDRHGFGMTVTRADAMVGGKIRIDLDVLLAR